MDESHLVDNDYEVEVTLAAGRHSQEEAPSPIYSIKRFEDIGMPQEILEACWVLNYRRPSKIQEKAIPLLFADPPKNFIGQSQSGTGKTAAFVINILRRLDRNLDACQALIIAPTRELAIQIANVTRQLSRFMELKENDIVVAVPGMLGQREMIKTKIMSGTPGTVLEILRKKRMNVKHLKYLVCDEADAMLESMAMGEQTIRVKNFLIASQADLRQIVLVSATYPATVVEFAEKFAPNANMITLQHHEMTLKGIKQLFLDCNDEEQKYRIVRDLYHIMTVGASIIFVGRRDTADRLQARLEADGHKCLAIHSALDNAAERDKVMDAVQNGRAKVLIATNLLARGIDVPCMSLVVNYDTPLTKDKTTDFDTYLHRIGRTGRFGRVGVSISFVHDHKSWVQLNEIQSHYEIRMTLVPCDTIEVMEQIVKKAMKTDETGLGDSLEQSRHFPRALDQTPYQPENNPFKSQSQGSHFPQARNQPLNQPQNNPFQTQSQNPFQTQSRNPFQSQPRNPFQG